MASAHCHSEVFQPWTSEESFTRRTRSFDFIYFSVSEVTRARPLPWIIESQNWLLSGVFFFVEQPLTSELHMMCWERWKEVKLCWKRIVTIMERSASLDNETKKTDRNPVRSPYSNFTRCLSLRSHAGRESKAIRTCFFSTPSSRRCFSFNRYFYEMHYLLFFAFSGVITFLFMLLPAEAAQ
jgi:hypothetical protein